MALDLNTTSGSLTLPASDSAEIFGKITRESAFQKLAKQISLPGTGTVVHTIGAGIKANIVGETEIKPSSSPAVASKLVQAHTFAVLIPVSNQLLSDASALVNYIQVEAPKAIATEFDNTVVGDAPAATNFDSLASATNAVVTDYTSFVAALGSVAASGVRPTGFAVSAKLFFELLGTVNDFGVPVFNIVQNSDGTGVINGIPYAIFDSADSKGFLGDFSSAVWGNVEGIQFSLSSEAAITIGGQLVSLYERNMSAIRIEARLGFRVADVANYRLITTAPVA